MVVCLYTNTHTDAHIHISRYWPHSDTPSTTHHHKYTLMGMRKPQGGQRYAANTCRNQAWERRVVVVKQREEFWKDGGSWDRGHGDKRARRVMEGERLVGAKGPNIKTCEELQCVRAKTRHHPPISPVALCGMPFHSTLYKFLLYVHSPINTFYYNWLAAKKKKDNWCEIRTNKC